MCVCVGVCMCLGEHMCCVDAKWNLYTHELMLARERTPWLRSLIFWDLQHAAIAHVVAFDLGQGLHITTHTCTHIIQYEIRQERERLHKHENESSVTHTHSPIHT